MKPESLSTQAWYEHTRTWKERTHCDARAAITPDVAPASAAHPWEIAVRLCDMALEPGDHVAVEVHVGWLPDRGRPFCYGRTALREAWRPGYNASPKFEFGAGVEHAWALSEDDGMNRYFIIDAVVTEGVVAAHSDFRVFLANPEGMLLRCPWFAQDVPVPVAIRKHGEAHYRRCKEIPVVRVRGGQPRMWKAIATPQPDHGLVRIQVTAADVENLNPSECAEDPQPLSCTGWDNVALVRESGYHGAPVWRATVRRTPDAAPRIEFLNRTLGLYGRSNPVAPGLQDGRQVYFGDLHGQSDRSIGFGSEREYFWWARDGELLDFVAPANHYGGRETVSQALWESTLGLCDEFHDPGRFATLYSYEWGGGKNAHRNVYYGEKPGALMSPKLGTRHQEIQGLWDDLERQALPVLTIPHHTKFISRIDWREWHASYQRLVEVCSCWGNSEQSGTHSVQHALAMGHRLGVVGGTDTHFSQPGRPAVGPFDLGGVTAVLTDRLERGAIWQALHDRRCYATTGERILLDFHVNGSAMGSELPCSDTRRITGQVVGTAELEAVEIIRNNVVWRRVALDGAERTAFDYEDTESFEDVALTPQVPADGPFMYYYLRVRQRDRHWAMSSPIWLGAQQA